MKSFDIANLLKVPNLSKYIDLVEKELDRVLINEHETIRTPIQRLIKARSKRLRPSILVAIVASKGLKIDKKVIASCVALELVHIASLVHDDIVDNANTRWGVPTVNAKEGVSLAVMIGDLLFSKANQQAALVSPEVSMIVAKSIELLCIGEMIEMVDEYNANRTTKSLIETIEGKTAALISATCQVAGYCAKLSQSEITALEKYGRYFGVSFQFVDDLLDFLSTEEILGKPIGNDVKEGVFTMPIIFGLKNEKFGDIRDWLKKDSNKSNDILVGKLFNSGGIEESLKLLVEYNELARSEIKYFKDDETKLSLLSLPDAYMNWAFENLVSDRYKLKIHKMLEIIKGQKTISATT